MVWQQVVMLVIFAVLIYTVTAFVFRLLLRGFAPFIPSRPWVVNELLREMELPRRKEGLALLAFSSGRSGFFHTLEKKYPEARLMAVESSFFPYLVAKVQGMLRRTRMEIVYLPVHQVPVKEFDFIYSHLYPDKMEGLGPKLKFECRPGTQVVSTGFNIPHLTSKKIVPLPDRKGRLDFLSRNQELFQSKRKKYKKEKKAFFYEI
jgi:hypothetical protein